MCPEKGRVLYSTCLRCPKYKNWSGEKDDLPQCKHEYEKLKSEGYYAADQDEWEEHMRDAIRTARQDLASEGITLPTNRVVKTLTHF